MSALPQPSETETRRTAMLRTAFDGPVGAALAAADTIEILANPDGSVWVEKAGFGLRRATETLGRAVARSESFGNAKLREVMARARVEVLTRREREVLSGVASGLSNRLIGEKLSISPRTVEIHRANMLNKLGARHTSEAIRIAIEAAMVS